MATEKKPPKMVAHRASDKRKGDDARRPKKVAEPAKYKMIPTIKVTKKTAGRPKKAS